MTKWRIATAGKDRFGTPYVLYKKRQGLSFSRTELLHIAVSVLVLTFAFTVFSVGPAAFFIVPHDVLLLLIGFSFLTVIISFLLHELAHKIVAQRFGCWAEYRFSNLGLLLTLLTAFMGFMFAAPGAVYFSGYTTKEETGKIGAAGPLTNLAVAFGVGVLFLSVLHWSVEFGTLGGYFILLNLFIGGFNMIPFDPFDGAKILRWSVAVYVAIFAALIGCAVLFFYILPGQSGLHMV